MTKTIVVNDRQFDWLSARARGVQTMAQALEQIITLVNRYEADLEKYRNWADASQTRKETHHDTLPLE